MAAPAATAERAPVPGVRSAESATSPDEPRLARRSKRNKKPKPRAAPAPAPAPAPAASAPAPAPEEADDDAPAPPAGAEAAAGEVLERRRSGPSRIEFDDRLIQGQTNKANAIYLFERRASELRTLVKKRRNYHREIDETLE